MSVTATGFVGERLSQARRAQSITASDLADKIGVSVQSLSKYENGHQVPRHETVDKLAAALSMPKPYFFRVLRITDSKPVFWRSKLTAQATDLDRAAVRLDWLKEVVDYLADFLEFPQLNLSSVALPEDPANISREFIEDVANCVRQDWGVHRGPLPDILEKIEASGILVSRIHVNADKVDAFSQWSDKFGIPFIMLSRDKASAARQRFDALHELAHILLHRNVTRAHLDSRAVYKMLEKQADTFASFMLLPEQDFLDELYAPTLDGMVSLKERWGTSVAAMIMRLNSLDIIDEFQTKRMWMNYTRRGWRKGEPFDGKTEKEEPYLIRRGFEMLIGEGVQTVADIRRALPFPPKDLEEIADLEPGTLGAAVDKRPEPVLKVKAERDFGNVVSLSDRRKS